MSGLSLAKGRLPTTPIRLLFLVVAYQTARSLCASTAAAARPGAGANGSIDGGGLGASSMLQSSSVKVSEQHGVDGSSAGALEMAGGGAVTQLDALGRAEDAAVLDGEGKFEARADTTDAAGRGGVGGGATTGGAASGRAAAVAAAVGRAELLRSHTFQLGHAVEAVADSLTPSNEELDRLIAQFIDRQASSQDKCPAQLLEAKRQLNTMHMQVRDLAAEVNASELDIQTETKELTNIHIEMNDEEEEEQEELDKCSEKHEEDKKMWEILKEELLEMYQIAHPDVTMDARSAYNRSRVEDAYRVSRTSTNVRYRTETKTYTVPPTSADFEYHKQLRNQREFDPRNVQAYVPPAPAPTYSATRWGSSSSASGATDWRTTGSTSAAAATTGARLIALPRQRHAVAVPGGAPAFARRMAVPGARGAAKSLLQTGAGMRPQAQLAGPGGRGIDGVAPSLAVSQARGLASEARSLAVQLGECLAGRREASFLEVDQVSPALAPASCPAGKPTAVRLAGYTNDFSSSAAFANGQFALHRCQEVNPSYDGQFALICSNGVMKSDTSRCTPSKGSPAPPRPATPAPTRPPPSPRPSLSVGSPSGTPSGGTSYSSTAGSGQNLWAGRGCRKDMAVTVTLDDSRMRITPNEDLPNGATDKYLCSAVNSKYTGVIWLHCADGFVTPDPSECILAGSENDTACEEQQLYLEEVYTKAYVELSRLVTEYEIIVNSTACEEAGKQSHKDKKKPLEVKIEKLMVEMTTRTEHMQGYRIRIQDMKKAEYRLRAHIQTLEVKCHEMDSTVSSLDKVRDAIHVLSLCPGLEPTQFRIPLWIGEWVTASFDTRTQTDEQIDDMMNALCGMHQEDSSSQKPRAAETSEIESRTVEGIPLTNTAPVPLFGTCPNCEGEPDSADSEVHASGHQRICWDEGSPLDVKHRRTTCGTGRKAVLCIVERADVRTASDQYFSAVRSVWGT